MAWDQPVLSFLSVFPICLCVLSFCYTSWHDIILLCFFSPARSYSRPCQPLLQPPKFHIDFSELANSLKYSSAFKVVHYVLHYVPNKHDTSMLAQCWASVVDDGPTLDQHWVDVSCLPHPAYPGHAQCCANAGPASPTMAQLSDNTGFTEVIDDEGCQWYTDPMLVQCWTSVADDSPTLNQHCVSVLCWLGLQKHTRQASAQCWHIIYHFGIALNTKGTTMHCFFVVHTARRLWHNADVFSHWFSLWDVYRYQPISHSSCSLSCNANVW